MINLLLAMTCAACLSAAPIDDVLDAGVYTATDTTAEQVKARVNIDSLHLEARLEVAALRARVAKAKQLILYNLEAKNWNRLDVLMKILKRDQLKLVKARGKLQRLSRLEGEDD
ncbi:MAG: hypothetical protein KOO63_05740 [Bacteroidales bacterium]|nr:hypothetical protein [Candidatus Latescibacterota bacterium]